MLWFKREIDENLPEAELVEIMQSLESPYCQFSLFIFNSIKKIGMLKI